MTVQAINNPFFIFTDVDGDPLEDGYIYVGNYGLDPETNPQTVYQDEDLIVPLPQPIRTKGGVPLGASSALVRIFTDGGYSIRAKDKRGNVVYNRPNSDAIETFNIIYAKFYGATGDGTTDDTTAINAAITAANSQGGGIIFFNAGTYLVSSTLTLYEGVTFQGEGSLSTIIKMADSQNKDVIKTDGFDTLTGNNKWLVSDNVPTGFGIKGIQINGNKANNLTSGAGVKIYGKRYIIDDVIIRETRGAGFYSEAGAVGGQSEYRDMPEALIRGLYIYAAEGKGVDYRGPHDMNMVSVFVSSCANNGVEIASDGSTYSGSGDIGFIHSYGNTGHGILINGLPIRARQLIGESNTKHGIYFATSDRSQVGIAQAYNNGQGAGSWAEIHVDSSSDNCQLSNVRTATLYDNIVAALDLQGVGTQVGTCFVGTSTGTDGAKKIGIRTANTGIRIGTGEVNGFDNTGGIGLSTNVGSAYNELDINLSIRDCTTLWNHANAGARSQMRLNLFGNAGQTLKSGAAIGTTEKVTGNAVSNGTVKYFEWENVETSVVDLTITSLQAIVVNHNMIETPKLAKVESVLVRDTNVSDWAVDFFQVSAVAAGTATIAIKLGTASATGGATSHLGIKLAV